MMNKLKLFFNNNLINYIKLFVKFNKIRIIKLLIILLWLCLFIFNCITIRRLVTFCIILLIILVYKQYVKYVSEVKPIKNENLIVLLINIDLIKLLLINIVIYLYIWLFNLLDKVGAFMPIEDNISLLNQLLIKLVKLLEWVVKSIIINPILIILHKFYYALYMLVYTSIKELLFQRVFGVILAVLIFTPILSNIFMMLGQS